MKHSRGLEGDQSMLCMHCQPNNFIEAPVLSNVKELCHERVWSLECPIDFSQPPALSCFARPHIRRHVTHRRLPRATLRRGCRPIRLLDEACRPEPCPFCHPMPRMRVFHTGKDVACTSEPERCAPVGSRIQALCAWCPGRAPRISLLTTNLRSATGGGPDLISESLSVGSPLDLTM